MDEQQESWSSNAVRAIAVAGVEILLSSTGVPGLATGAGIVIQHIVDRRRRTGEEHIEMVISDIGSQDKLIDALMSDDERGEVLWSSVQAAMATSIEGKRIYLARVAAQAMTGDRATVDHARLIVDALTELDGPHVDALVRIRAADDADRANGMIGNDDALLEKTLDEVREPVLAALVRTGVVLVGPQQHSPGLLTTTSARNYTIGGINKFGRELLADLESVDPRLRA